MTYCVFECWTSKNKCCIYCNNLEVCLLSKEETPCLVMGKAGKYCYARVNKNSLTWSKILGRYPNVSETLVLKDALWRRRLKFTFRRKKFWMGKG